MGVGGHTTRQGGLSPSAFFSHWGADPSLRCGSSRTVDHVLRLAPRFFLKSGRCSWSKTRAHRNLRQSQAALNAHSSHHISKGIMNKRNTFLQQQQMNLQAGFICSQQLRLLSCHSTLDTKYGKRLTSRVAAARGDFCVPSPPACFTR